MAWAVKYDYELVRSVFPPWRRTRNCDKCRHMLKEIAEECWVEYYTLSATCPAGGMHIPQEPVTMMNMCDDVLACEHCGFTMPCYNAPGHSGRHNSATHWWTDHEIGFTGGINGPTLQLFKRNTNV